MPLRSSLAGSIKPTFGSIFEKKKNYPTLVQPRCLSLKGELPVDIKQNEIIEEIKSQESTISIKKKKRKRLPGMRLVKDFISRHYSNMESNNSNSEVENQVEKEPIEEQPMSEDIATEKKSKSRNQKGSGLLPGLPAEKILELLQEVVKSIVAAFFRGITKDMSRGEAKRSKKTLFDTLLNGVKDITIPTLRGEAKDFASRVGAKITELMEHSIDGENVIEELSTKLSKGFLHILNRLSSGKLQEASELSKASRAMANRVIKTLRN